MKWSDGEPATSEDARCTYQLVLDGVASERGYVGAGYLDPYLTNAGVKTGAPRRTRRPSSSTTEFPTTLLTQAYVPILPKHIWSKYTLDQIDDPEAADFFKNEPPVVGTGPYQVVEWEPGEFVRFARNPNYWGAKGAADEVIIQHFASADTDGPGPQARRDRLRPRRRRRPVRRARQRAEHRDRRRLRQRLHRARRSTPRATPRATAARRRRSRTRRSATPSATPSTSRSSSTRRSAATASSGTTNVPPYHADWHVEPTTPRRFDIAEANQRLDAAGYPSSTPPASGSTRRASRSTCA